MSLGFTGERIVPGAVDCEPTFAQKMYQEHVARYAFASQFVADKDVLDVGCGVGYGSQWLAKSGARSVLGIDLSPEAIEHARHNYFHPAVTFTAQDAGEIEAGDGYDLITCFELIEHIEQQEEVLDRIKAAMRDDGLLVISTPRPLDDIRTHFHVHEMSFEELFGLLKQRFRHVEAYFEVNCFTSFVGRESPSALNRIVPISDQLTIDRADYFIFLASDTPVSETVSPDPVLTLNDDSYILTLEKDVGVLRRAEEDFKARVAALETEKQALASSRDEAVQKGAAMTTINQETNAIRLVVEDLQNRFAHLAETEQLRRRIEQLEGERISAVQESRLESLEAINATSRTEVNELRAVLFETQSKLSRAETVAHSELAAKSIECDSHLREAQRLRSSLLARETELDTVRRVIAENASRLADAETLANTWRADVERLPAMIERCSALESEINAVRYRLDYAEATLTRFRRSLSWALTRPIRWIGRTFKALRRRSQEK